MGFNRFSYFNLSNLLLQMDSAQFLLGQIQSIDVTLTNIQAVGAGLGIVVSILIMWGLMTKNINEKIKGKADCEATAIRFNSIEKEIRYKDEEYRSLLMTQQDTNTKVTEIWQFLANKKS